MQWRAYEPGEVVMPGEEAIQAAQYAVAEKTLVIVGTGPVEAGDAEKLEAVYRNKAGKPDDWREHMPQVWLDSPGGDALEGMRIGETIRRLRLGTYVAADAFCASACTAAFLGGLERRVEGPFLIHAAAPASENPDMDSIVDVLQQLTSIYLAYTTAMIGDDTMAQAALAFGSGGKQRDARPLDDAELRDWSVITTPARPAQAYDPESLRTIDCSGSGLPSVRKLVCGDLELGRLDYRLAEAFLALRNESDFPLVDTQQRKWSGVRDDCEQKYAEPAGKRPTATDIATEALNLGTNGSDTDTALGEYLQTLIGKKFGSGDYAVRNCLVNVYTLRVTQLEALVAYHKISGTGWN